MAATDEKLEEVNIDELFGRKSFISKALDMGRRRRSARLVSLLLEDWHFSRFLRSLYVPTIQKLQIFRICYLHHQPPIGLAQTNLGGIF